MANEKLVNYCQECEADKKMVQLNCGRMCGRTPCKCKNNLNLYCHECGLEAEVDVLELLELETVS